ncbi:hypothetical protein SLEP1_g4005 [Rubroshorea leprosula]|uniref:Uncharacterized protein n=1 Tax=Rubroshorea leprosula TaxID=152421 RepID=A0AAV5HTR8_9ROSI|nr:hypothetical protein SLEP1_g4005 [Rubroshorea leprosula]
MDCHSTLNTYHWIKSIQRLLLALPSDHRSPYQLLDLL